MSNPKESREQFWNNFPAIREQLDKFYEKNQADISKANANRKDGWRRDEKSQGTGTTRGSGRGRFFTAADGAQAGGFEGGRTRGIPRSAERSTAALSQMVGVA